MSVNPWELIAGLIIIAVLVMVSYAVWPERDEQNAGEPRRVPQRNGDGVEPTQSPLRGSPVTDFFAENDKGNAA
jgi:hypothetical protein